MQNTIAQPLPPRSPDKDTFWTWLAFEGMEFLRQVRQALNFEFHATAELTTGGTGTATTIWTSADMPVGSAWAIDARVVARAVNNDGADGRVDICALFSRQGDASLQTGATTTLVAIGPHLLTFLASGSGVLVRVQDDGIHTVDWAVDVRVREVRAE